MNDQDVCLFTQSSNSEISARLIMRILRYSEDVLPETIFITTTKMLGDGQYQVNMLFKTHKKIS